MLPLLSCGELPDPESVLQETPRPLGFRAEVVEPGEASVDLLPIPADRVRSDPLPGDVVEISAFVASADGELDVGAMDPAWFLCPRGGCVSTLGFEGGGEPCEGERPEDAACLLTRGERAHFVMPPFDPELPLDRQLYIRVAFVGHAEDGPSTDTCIERLGSVNRPRWDGCVVGYHAFAYGPLARVVELADQQGIELPDDVDEPEVSALVVPHFNPEITALRLSPTYRGFVPDESRTIVAQPGGVTRIERGYPYSFEVPYDPRDAQTGVLLIDGQLDLMVGEPLASVWTDTPGVYEGSSFVPADQLVWPQGDRFSLFVVIDDSFGGRAWSTFTFEVVDP